MIRILTAYLIVLVITSCGCDKPDSQNLNTTYIHPSRTLSWGFRKATPFKLRLFIGNETTFNDPQGIACAHLISRDDPDSDKDDHEVAVLGVNSGANCIIYNKTMLSLDVYGLEEDHYQFNKPWGIAAGKNGDVFVVDRGNSSLVQLHLDRKLEFVQTIGEPGDKNGQFIDPRCVAIDNNGNIYVSDAALGRITIFTSDGEYSHTINGLNSPDGIAVIGPDEKWTSDKSNYFLVVSDSLNKKLVKFSLDSLHLEKSVTTAEIPVDDSEFDYLAIDYHGQIVCTDRPNGCLHKFDSDLNYLTSFGKTGSNDHEFNQPRGICINKRFGQLFVAERDGAQYFLTAIDVPLIEANVRKQDKWSDLDIDLFLTEPGIGKIDLMDKYGRLLTNLVQNWKFNTGHNHISWGMEITDAAVDASGLPPGFETGKPIPEGDYILRGKFRAFYSSREIFECNVEKKIHITP